MGDPLRDNSAESLMGRLNQIDVRLRQLEEKDTVPESYFTADLRARGKAVASVLEDVQLKNTLMSRLNLLEARIRQLSDGLDKGGSSTGCSSRDLCTSSNTMLVKQVMNEGEGITYPAENQKLMRSNIGSRGLSGTWRAGADIFQSHRSKKANDPMKAATTEAMEKRTAAFCRNEKRRMEHTRLYRRWFPLGC